jgi:acetyl esterase/lipase
MSQAAKDAAYNNAAAVADSANLSAARRAASAEYRAAHAGHLDLPYGPGARQKWDIYPGAAGAPCLVFIHGGYWFMNSREDFAIIAAGAAAHGWTVALPSYTLAPAATLSEIVAEMGLALDYLAGVQAELGFGKVVLAGWSAGAQLAALWLHHPLPAAGLLISGVYELGPLTATYLQEHLRLTPTDIEAASPLRRPVTDVKPTIIAYGDEELATLVTDSNALHEHRLAAGAPSQLMPIHANHFTILHELTTPDGLLTKVALTLA